MLLLTGVSGFLGKKIKKSIDNNFGIQTLSRNSGTYKFDLTNTIPVFINEFDIVIHNAGKAHFLPKNGKENESFFNVNVKGTENLLRGIELIGSFPKSFVFISTVAVYGLEQAKEINENTPLQAKDPYGLSKIQAEQLVLEWCDSNNVICTILRLPLLVGENPPGNLGAMIKAIQKSYYFNIAGGKARKSMVLAEDVAKIIIKASEIGGIYNLTDGYHPNFYELSHAVGKQFGKSRIFNLPFFVAKTIALVGDAIGTKFPLDSNKLRKITSDLTFDDSKARQFLGWNPSKVLDYYKKIEL
jgi:nucleoside-diphosphate-sugar epimerase